MSETQLIWVDDEPMWVEPYIDYLEESGYKVRFYLDADSADAEYDKLVDAKAIILDVMMPGGSLFTYTQTEGGQRTGLLLLALWKDRIIARKQPVFVLTNRDVPLITAGIEAFKFPKGLLAVEHKKNTSIKDFPRRMEALLRSNGLV